MGRLRKNPLPATDAAPETNLSDNEPVDSDLPGGTGSETAAKRRRRRRQAAPDYAGETVALVEAALKSRGSKGATQETLQNVISWARSVRAEGEELKVLQSRPRRPKTQAAPDRLVKYEMNRALLDGILAGTIVLDVQENGDLVFRHGAYIAPSAIRNDAAVPEVESRKQTDAD